MTAAESPEPDDDEIITCWCGAKGTYDELFDDDGLDDGCGGTGFLECRCGGDQCVRPADISSHIAECDTFCYDTTNRSGGLGSPEPALATTPARQGARVMTANQYTGPRPIGQRLDDKTDKTPGHGPDGDCWLWTGCRNNHGYGRINVRRRAVYSHRVAYELAFGGIPEGIGVLHRCDTPACVNPSHLFLGTIADNNRDCREKGRHSCGDRPKGESHGGAKLTEPDVIEIRDAYASGGLSLSAIAARHGVSKKLVLQIVKNRIWKHVGPSEPRSPRP